ncbi:YopJ family acetyltransferase [Xenorhabdus doucetiae]|uniref:YopJ family protease n=1 Tax=Xenorhabdus doucetiae TaxID=351671 RepID=A0A068QW43_9GAMM|nr:YopJ family acetyltransferase [Xenorhabdus doucetiae]TYP07534.1 YopJ family protease [Xenorhabdus doucetiae]CDG19009.1 protein of unknown function [Xenorhabdus doucetiae]
MNRNNLLEYRDEILRKKETHKQFDKFSLDQGNIRQIINVLNMKYVNMNTELLLSQLLTPDILNNLPPSSHKRFILQTNTGGTGQHFTATNVFKDSEGRISIIAIDSGIGSNAFIHFNIHRNFLNSNPEKLKKLYIYSQIQNSPADCLIFSVHFVKKMYKHQTHFVELHHKLFNDQISFIFEKDKYHPENSRQYNNEDCASSNAVYLDQAIKLLPIDFFKHAQSRSIINAYLECHPNERLKTVNKQKWESLEKRYTRHATVLKIGDEIQYYTKTGEPKIYSNSIEAKRLSLVEEALKWMIEHDEF